MHTRLLVLSAVLMLGSAMGALAGNAAVAGMQTPQSGYALPLAGDEQTALSGMRDEATGGYEAGDGAMRPVGHDAAPPPVDGRGCSDWYAGDDERCTRTGPAT